MYRLFYINKYGQVCNADGELELNVPPSKTYFEEYEDLEKAKSIAEEFVKNRPLLGCMISPGENGEKELIISADEQDRTRALKKKEFEVQAKAILKKTKTKRLIYLGVIVISLVSLLVFLAY